MSNKDFLKKVASAKAALAKAKNAKAGGGLIEVPDGRYIVRLEAVKFDVNKRGSEEIPFVQFTARVVGGQDSEDSTLGGRVGKRVNLKAQSGVKNGKPWQITLEDCLADVCTTLQAFGVDTSGVEDFEDLIGLTEDLQGALARCQIKAKGDYQNCYFNAGKPALEDDEYPTLEEVLQSEEETDEDSEEESEEESETELPFGVGDEVSFKFGKMKKAADFTVKAIDGDTVTLVDSDGDEVEAPLSGYVG